MTPERARELRDRIRPRPKGTTLRPGALRESAIYFDRAWPDQAEQALQILDGIEHLKVKRGKTPNSICIAYRVTDYTLHGIEAALISLGFHLDNSWWRRAGRFFAYFGEETELRNLSVPERLIKKSNEVYSKAWEHHPHGDHDDTPLDLREEK